MRSHTRGYRVALTVIALALVHRADAQRSPVTDRRLVPGAKIRFEVESGGRREGRFVSLDPDKLVAKDSSGEATAFPLHDVSAFDVADSRPARMGYGMVIGAMSGLMLGGVTGAIVYKHPDIVFGSQTDAVKGCAAVGGVGGLVIGAALGVISHERWHRIQLAGHNVGTTVPTLPSGTRGFGLAVAF